jgi:hypothetical protein
VAHVYIEVRAKAPHGTVWMMPAGAMGMLDEPVRSPQWTRYAVEADVPDTADTITIGMALAGNGAGWFSDLELETD